MKLTKQYTDDVIVIKIEEQGMLTNFIALKNDRQMRRLGECLIDLERTGAKEVEIIPKEE